MMIIHEDEDKEKRDRKIDRKKGAEGSFRV